MAVDLLFLFRVLNLTIVRVLCQEQPLLSLRFFEASVEQEFQIPSAHEFDNSFVCLNLRVSLFFGKRKSICSFPFWGATLADLPKNENCTVGENNSPKAALLRRLCCPWKQSSIRAFEMPRWKMKHGGFGYQRASLARQFVHSRNQGINIVGRRMRWHSTSA